MKRMVLTIGLFIGAISVAGNTGNKTIIVNSENSGKMLPLLLVKQHCVNMGFSAKDCEAKDFEGVAVDLNGNTKPEFLLRNAKLEKNTKTCVLYMDEKSAYMFVQAEMPCFIELMKTKTNSWFDIKGVIYPTECEPLKCEYKWGGSSYIRAGCVPFEDEEGCQLE